MDKKVQQLFIKNVLKNIKLSYTFTFRKSVSFIEERKIKEHEKLKNWFRSSKINCAKHKIGSNKKYHTFSIIHLLVSYIDLLFLNHN